MYFLWLKDTQTGPFSLEEVQDRWKARAIHGEILYWQEGMAEWQPLHAIHHVIEGAPARMVISGPWRRAGAFLSDVVLLAVAGYVSGLTLFDFYMGLGSYGIFLGFAIATAYFGLLESTLGAGQTLGKRVFRIRVVDAAGNGLSPARSVLRYLVLSLPFWIYKVLAVGFLSLYFWGEFLLSAIALIALAVLLYLYVFNRGTRQSVHDLAVGAYVVRTSSPKDAIAPKIWRGHLIAVGILYLVLAIGFFGAGMYLSRTVPFQRNLALREVLVLTGGYRTASVQEGMSNVVPPSHAGSSRICTADVVLKTRPRSMETAADELAGLVLKADASVAQDDYLRVSVTYGYDIGIASSFVSEGYARTPVQWKERSISSVDPSD